MDGLTRPDWSYIEFVSEFGPIEDFSFCITSNHI